MKRQFALCLIVASLAACHKTGGSGGASDAGTPQAAAAAVSVTPGSAITSAAAAKVGMTVAGEIVDKEPSNFYRFDNTGTLRDIVKVRLENKSTTLSPDFKIYNADKSQLLEKDDGTPGANVEQDISMDPGQTIYVEVLPWSSVGKYELSLTPQHAYDANEPDDDQLHTTPLTFGDSIEGSVMDDKDSDWFHVTSPTTGKVDISVENESTTLRPGVKVYSQSKSQIVEKDDGTPGASLDFMVDVAPGQDFYVQIVPWSSTGKYKLTVRAAV